MNTADFRNPDFYYNDWPLINPLRIPGWCAGLLELLAENNTALLRAWTSGTHLDLPPASLLFADESSYLQAEFVDLASEARAEATLDGYKHPTLKGIWWAATRGRTPPLSNAVAGEYLTYTAFTRDTAGGVTTAQSALRFVGTPNGWDCDLIFGGRATIPASGGSTPTRSKRRPACPSFSSRRSSPATATSFPASRGNSSGA